MHIERLTEITINNYTHQRSISAHILVLLSPITVKLSDVTSKFGTVAGHF